MLFEIYSSISLVCQYYLGSLSVLLSTNYGSVICSYFSTCHPHFADLYNGWSCTCNQKETSWSYSVNDRVGVLLYGFINDTLLALLVIESIYISYYTSVVFVFTQSSVIGQILRLHFRTAERLSRDLAKRSIARLEISRQF